MDEAEPRNELDFNLLTLSASELIPRLYQWMRQILTNSVTRRSLVTSHKGGDNKT